MPYKSIIFNESAFQFLCRVMGKRAANLNRLMYSAKSALKY
jgi:hypothetical protein